MLNDKLDTLYLSLIKYHSSYGIDIEEKYHDYGYFYLFLRIQYEFLGFHRVEVLRMCGFHLTPSGLYNDCTCIALPVSDQPVARVIFSRKYNETR